MEKNQSSFLSKIYNINQSGSAHLAQWEKDKQTYQELSDILEKGSVSPAQHIPSLQEHFKKNYVPYQYFQGNSHELSRMECCISEYKRDISAFLKKKEENEKKGAERRALIAEENAIKREQQLAKEKRLYEQKVFEEAQRRIKEAAETAAFELAVQEKMKQLLASSDTLESRMKLREAELSGLFTE